MKPAFKSSNSQKFFLIKTKFKFNIMKKVFFYILQELLFKPIFLTHFNIKYILYINLNVSKQFRFKIIIYYIKLKFSNKFKVLLIKYLI